jgi:hypothetical protein
MISCKHFISVDLGDVIEKVNNYFYFVLKLAVSEIYMLRGNYYVGKFILGTEYLALHFDRIS